MFFVKNNIFFQIFEQNGHVKAFSIVFFRRLLFKICVNLYVF